MGRFAITLCFIFILSWCFGQVNNDDRIKQLPALIESAAKKGDYELAASLKAELATRQQIKEAVNAGDYAKAAELNKKIAGAGGSNAEVQRQINEAVSAGDYAKAAELKKKLTIRFAKSSPASYSGSLPEPEFTNQIFYFKEKTSELVKLEESQTNIEKDSYGAPFWGGTKAYYSLKGRFASAKVSGQDNHAFVVKYLEGNDPKESIVLLKFLNADPKGKELKDRVCLVYRNEGTVFKSATKENQERFVPVSFEKVSNGLFKIIPSNRLTPGEYSFCMNENRMFAFSVD